MNTTQLHPGRPQLRNSLLASLVPWAAFLGATVLADVWVDHKATSYGGLAAAAPFYLGFVALPSVLPLAAARRGVLWIAVLVVMTAVAAVAGTLAVTTDDAQAGLAVLWVPLVAVPLACVLWVGQAVAQRRATAERPQTSTVSAVGLSDRFAALTIDLVILGAALVVPLTAMSHAKQEMAAGVLGIGVATIYLGALVSMRGGTIGHSLLGLAVVDASTGRRATLPRSLARGVIVALEVAAAPTIILSPIAFAELISASASGRSLTDRLLRTEVVATR